ARRSGASLAPYPALLEGNLVGIEGLLTFARARGCRRLRAHPASAIGTRVEHLEVRRGHVEACALPALAVRVHPRVEPSFDVDQTTLRDHLLSTLGEVRPAADPEAVGLLLPCAFLAAAGDPIDREAELADRAGVWSHAKLWIAADVSDEGDPAD